MTSPSLTVFNLLSAFRLVFFLICSQSLAVTAFLSPCHHSIIQSPVNSNVQSIDTGPRYSCLSRKQQSSLSMINNLFSGLSGKPPDQLLASSLQTTLLTNTNIDPNKPNVDLKCIYKASKDGFSAIDFHKLCDGRGSGLVVILTKSGKVFGGFNPLGWDSTDDYGNTNSAFLWFQKGSSVEKCKVLSGGNAAIFDYATGGPQFGSGDLIIGPPKAAIMGGFAGPNMEDTSVNAGDLRKATTSSFGGAYDSGRGWPRGSHNVVEVEVYANGNIQPRSSGGGFQLWPFK